MANTVDRLALAPPVQRSVPGAALMLHVGTSDPEERFHSHDVPLASFMLDGACDEIDERGRRHRLMSGGIYLTPVGMRHAHVQTSPLAKVLCVAFGPALQSLSTDGNPGLSRPVLRHAPSISNVAGRLADEIGQRDPASDLIVQGLLIELVGTFAREERMDEAKPPRWLRQAAELLRENEGLKLSVVDIANVVAVHPSHLIRSFKAHFGLTPGEYARRVRLDRCRSVVRHGDRPLSAIAEDAGFADAAHFSREFKRAFGITPSAYRRGT